MESGSVLAGKYQLISLLGSGGMGTVWRAEHLGLRAPIAIKLLGPAISPTPEALARFHREAQSAARLRGPHVVQILDHGIDEATSTPFIAMELLEGESLAERLERVSRLTLAETSRVATHIARALTRAHELGIVHRDLKPGNVFLVQNDDEETLKVLDFGLAKWDESSASALGVATVTGTFVGTAYYMSPEQVEGQKADQRADLWAFAVLVYECLTGQRPFEADNVLALATRISSGKFAKSSTVAPLGTQFDAWFERAFALDAQRRFQSAREMTEELRRLCASSAIPLEESADRARPAPLRVASEPREPREPQEAAAPAAMEQTVACFNPDGTLADPDQALLEAPKAEDHAAAAAASSVEPLTRTVETKRGRRSLGVMLAGASALALLVIVGVVLFARPGTKEPPAVGARAVPVAVSATLVPREPAPARVAEPAPIVEPVAAAPAEPERDVAAPAVSAALKGSASKPQPQPAPRAAPASAARKTRSAPSASASAAAPAPDVFRTRK